MIDPRPHGSGRHQKRALRLVSPQHGQLARRETQRSGPATNETEPKRMERRDVHLLASRAHQAHQPGPELLCRFRCERQCQHPTWRDGLPVDQVGDTGGKDHRLPAPRSGSDEQGTGWRGDGRLLLVSERGQRWHMHPCRIQ